MTHGKVSTYNRQGCRCDACRTAKVEYLRRWQATRPIAEHGTPARYRQGCRCDGCKAAIRAATTLASRRSRIRVDRELLGDLLRELFPAGLTDQCPARRGQ